MFKKSLIAAVAALTLAAAAALPAHAISKKGAAFLGIGIGSAIALGAAAAAHDRHRYYEDDGYYYAGGGYRYRSERREYRYWANECAARHGWETRRWFRCMDRQGF